MTRDLLVTSDGLPSHQITTPPVNAIIMFGLNPMGFNAGLSAEELHHAAASDAVGVDDGSWFGPRGARLLMAQVIPAPTNNITRCPLLHTLRAC